MAPKAVFKAIKIENVSVVAANILKQDMLSRGGEAATSNATINHTAETTDVILFGTIKQYSDLVSRLKTQQFKLPDIAISIENALNNLNIEFVKKTNIMGILNVTPDSFSDGGVNFSVNDAVASAMQMISDGADIIDVGGESTRPGAKEVSVDEEIGRVIPVINGMRSIVGANNYSPVQQNQNPIISIDTRKSDVAEAAIKAGAGMINDVSGLRYDAKMASVAAKYGVPVVVMHAKGNPDNMQNDPQYFDVISEMFEFFIESIDIAKKAGVEPKNIILDPGIGFGKTFEHNIEIIRRIEEFRSLGYPICIGPSRKAFIGEITGEKNPQKRLDGTAAVIALAVSKKVDIIRIHDVFFMKMMSAVLDRITRRE